ncbi:hypothetical protein AAC387_Pa03g2113 [Persea americana]
MEYRSLDLTIISAKGLKNVNLFAKMNVYAMASLSSDPRTKKRTPVDKEGGQNPTWNASMEFSIPTSNPSNLFLHIQLKCRCFLGHCLVGDVHIPVKDLLLADGKPAHFVSYQVRKPSGKPQGVLSLSYKLQDQVALPLPGPGFEQPLPDYHLSMGPVPSACETYPYPSCYDEPLQSYVYGYPPTVPQGYGDVCPPMQQANAHGCGCR